MLCKLPYFRLHIGQGSGHSCRRFLFRVCFVTADKIDFLICELSHVLIPPILFFWSLPPSFGWFCSLSGQLSRLPYPLQAALAGKAFSLCRTDYLAFLYPEITGRVPCPQRGIHQRTHTLWFHTLYFTFSQGKKGRFIYLVHHHKLLFSLSFQLPFAFTEYAGKACIIIISAFYISSCEIGREKRNFRCEII